MMWGKGGWRRGSAALDVVAGEAEDVGKVVEADVAEARGPW